MSWADDGLDELPATDAVPGGQALQRLAASLRGARRTGPF
jgi:hypothetical protein